MILKLLHASHVNQELSHLLDIRSAHPATKEHTRIAPANPSVLYASKDTMAWEPMPSTPTVSAFFWHPQVRRLRAYPLPSHRLHPPLSLVHSLRLCQLVSPRRNPRVSRLLSPRHILLINPLRSQVLYPVLYQAHLHRRRLRRRRAPRLRSGQARVHRAIQARVRR